MERGFVDGAPGLAFLGLAEVWEVVGAVVLGVGEHQFVGKAVEGAAGEAEVMGFYSVVFDAEDRGRGGDSAGPGGGVGAFRGNQGVADGAAIIGPAGAVWAMVEIVVEAAVDVVVIVVLVGGVEVLLFFVGGRAVVIDSGLFHRVLVLIQDVGHPAIFVVETEPGGVDAIGPVLDTGHTGAIVIRHVALKCGFPAIAAPINAEQKAATLVADRILLIHVSTGI